MSRIDVRDGRKADALAFREAHGGQLYIGREELWITVAGGKRKGIFWHPSEKGQQMKADTYALAQMFELPISQHSDLTPGKLGCIFWKDIIRITPQEDKEAGKKSGYYGDGWYKLAKKKTKPSFEVGNDEDFDHWHFEFWQEHEPQWLIDRDIKSAFGNALISAPTLFLHEPKNAGANFVEKSTFVEDGGAMERVREWFPHLPKWFRHRMVGTLASHRYGVKWGAAFNAAQRAILKVYETMMEAREIAGDYCVRAYVDCLTLKSSTPLEVILTIERFLESKGFVFGTKALGYGQLWSSVEGYIGWQNYIGTDFEVKSKIKKLNLKQDHRAFNDELVQNFGDRLSTHVLKHGDRKIYGHWNGAGFFAVCQPVTGSVEGKSQWYQVYPDTQDKEEWERKRSQIEKLVQKI